MWNENAAIMQSTPKKGITLSKLLIQKRHLYMLPNYPAEEGIVKRMREIRDEQSAITMNMTFEEVKAYYRERILKEDPDFYKKVEEDKKKQL